MAIHLNHRQNIITTGTNAEAQGVTLKINNTGSLTLPKGGTATRPATPEAGDFRFNTDTGVLEYYDGTTWKVVAAGASQYVEDLRDSNGTLIVDGVPVAGAVNYIQATNATTGNGVSIAAAGSDANVDLTLAAKGSGSLLLQGGSATVDLDPGSTFAVTDGTNTGLSVALSGPNGFSLEAGGSEARLSTSGDLFIQSTGGDVRVGNGTTDGLVINTNTPGDGLTVTTGAGQVGLTTQTKFVFDTAGAAGTVAADFSGKRIANVADPVDPTDVANKRYVDNVVSGIDWKESVRVATTGNVDLATGGLLTIDGVTLQAGDRVLVKDQTDPTENGIYIASSGSWTRAPDADQDSEVTAGLAVFVSEGTVNGNTAWVLITNDPITLGTTGLTFTQFYGPSSISLIGGTGISVSQSGTTYTINADTDGATMWVDGSDQLAVYWPGGTPGKVLIGPASPGTAVWGKVDLSNTTDHVTGTLGVGNGGTGLTNVPVGALLYGNGANPLQTLAIGTASDANTAYVLKTNVSGTAPEWGTLALNQLSDVSAVGASNGDVLQFNGTEWVPVAGSLADRNVAVTVNDTTPGHLNDKLVVNVSGALTKTVLNPGANEQLELKVNYDDTTIILDGGNLAVGGGLANQVLVGNGGNAPAVWTSSAWLKSVALAGNTAGDATVTLDAINDTLTLTGGIGIRLTGADATNTVTVTFTNDGMADTPVTASDLVPFFDVSNLSQAEYRSFGNVLSDLNVPNGITVSGFVVHTGGGTYTSRSIVANTSADRVGIEVLNGDGVAGDPTVGLNIEGLTDGSAAIDSAADYVVLYDSSADANVKVTVQSLVNAATLDFTRIHNAADTTYVDTDEVVDTVVVANQGKYTAWFKTGSQTTGLSAQYFVFDSGTSAGTLRLLAQGDTADIDIRLVPQGAGSVIIGETGHGLVQAEDTYNLTVAGGNNGGNLYLKGGSTGGLTVVQTDAGNDFVTFNNNQSITIQVPGDANAKSDDFVFTVTTTNNTATTLGAIALNNDESVLFEAYIVAREQTATGGTKVAGYKLRGVAYNDAGTANILDVVVQEIIAEGANATTYDATATASGANLVFSVTGGATDNVKWVGFIKTVRVVY